MFRYIRFWLTPVVLLSPLPSHLLQTPWVSQMLMGGTVVQSWISVVLYIEILCFSLPYLWVSFPDAVWFIYFHSCRNVHLNLINSEDLLQFYISEWLGVEQKLFKIECRLSAGPLTHRWDANMCLWFVGGFGCGERGGCCAWFWYIINFTFNFPSRAYHHPNINIASYFTRNNLFNYTLYIFLF